MEWWYKSDKYPVNTQSITQLSDTLNRKLMEGNMVRTTSLWDDEKYFYIRTSNNIFLHTFLWEHGFNELSKNKPDKQQLNLILGTY